MVNKADFLLEQSAIVSYCETLRLPVEITEAIGEASSSIRRDARLLEAIANCCRLLFQADGGWKGREAAIRQYNELLRSSEEKLAAMLAPVIMISGLPYTTELYRSRGIPDAVLLETLGDLQLRMQLYRDKHGRWGTDSFAWLCHQFTGGMFRLGRLQFHLVQFPYPMHVFRRAGTREVAIFPESGISFRADGCINGTNGIDAPTWTSRLEITGRYFAGNRIDSDGFGHPDTTLLAAEEWEHVLKPKDTIIKIHIPQDGKMSRAACRQSYARAVPFFEKHFPETPFAAMYCATWLLSPQWQQLLPAESNIAQFRHDYHPFPLEGDDGQMFERVFGAKPADLAIAPRDTLLRRVVLDRLSAGGVIHSGAGIILKEEANGYFE
ncbi:acyltransferase domain-containing protein [Paenibacillus hodogayensis]|uniref:Acyltransferase domain-containing protein n=1 Tax=Paenibacillus hodogayensis TaxID=279208 RepID=A0ABV5VQ01_9BACL